MERSPAVLARVALAAGAMAAGAPTMSLAQEGDLERGFEPPPYRDDRSTPQAVLQSLYNAVERKEYLRAYSYFLQEPGRPDFSSFAEGYETTESVRLKLGTSRSEGAAGSIYSSVPAVVEAVTSEGAKQVYAGCYELRLVQPAIQATPPFQPLGIVEGRLDPVPVPFDAAQGECPESGS